MMELDPGLVCYKHCARGLLVGSSLPSSCLHCHTELHTTHSLLDTPYRLPYPFRRASQSPCSIVIKPTKGDFLHDYNSGNDLHIGVTDSDGCVHEFDSEGLHNDNTNSFNQCLVVTILDEPDDPVWQEYWNTALTNTTTCMDWSEERYDEHSYNCYSFVLEFLRVLQPPILSHFQLSKVSFCSSFVVPKATAAARYITIYRKVKQEGAVAIKLPENQTQDALFQDTNNDDTGKINKDNTPDLQEKKNNIFGGRQYKPSDDNAENKDNENNNVIVNVVCNKRVSEKDLLKKLDNLVVANCRLVPTRSNVAISNIEKKLRPRQRIEPQTCFDTTKITNKWKRSEKRETSESDQSSDSDMENKISQVIDDLLKNRHLEESYEYFTHYADDIKEGLRSLVPKASKPVKSFVGIKNDDVIVTNSDSFKLNLLVKSPYNNNTVQKCDTTSLVGERNDMVTIKSQEESSKFVIGTGRTDHANNNVFEHLVDSNCQNSDNKNNHNNDLKQKRPTTSSLRNTFSSNKPENNSIPVLGPLSIDVQLPNINRSTNTSFSKSSVNKYRASKSENYCPEYDWFGGNSNRLKQKRRMSNIWVESNKLKNTSSSDTSNMTYDEWVKNEGKVDEDKDILSSNLLSIANVEKFDKEKTITDFNIVNRVNEGNISKIIIPARNVSNEQNNLPFTPARKSQTGGIPVIPTQHNFKNTALNHNFSYMINENHQLFANEKDQSGEIVHNVFGNNIYNDEGTKGQQRESKTYLKQTNLARGRPVKREPTWRYGQEPCPQNYEGKLLGKIDLSKKKHEWQTKGQPSTLSMPGYIYDDGVLTETRC